jgi:hypothetical protein
VEYCKINDSLNGMKHSAMDCNTMQSSMHDALS